MAHLLSSSRDSTRDSKAQSFIILKVLSQLDSQYNGPYHYKCMCTAFEVVAYQDVPNS